MFLSAVAWKLTILLGRLTHAQTKIYALLIINIDGIDWGRAVWRLEENGRGPEEKDSLVTRDLLAIWVNAEEEEHNEM